MKYRNHIVFGGQGFIGQNLCKVLSNHGCDFICSIDKNIWGVEYADDLRARNNFFTISADICEDKAQIQRQISEYQFSPRDTMVWHLAANSDIQTGNDDINVDLTDTFFTTLRIVDLCREFGLMNLSFASSSAVYGSWGEARPYNENDKTCPISNYGAMKLASEAVLSVAKDEFLNCLNIFRFPNVIGVPATHGVIKDLIEKLEKNRSELHVLGNGLQNKPYLHVDDLIDAMLLICDSNQGIPASNTYNIASKGPNVFVKEIAEMVVEAVNPSAKIIYGTSAGGWRGDVPQVNFDTTKLEKLGWSCRSNGHDAVRKTIKSIIGGL